MLPARGSGARHGGAAHGAGALPVQPLAHAALAEHVPAGQQLHGG